MENFQLTVKVLSDTCHGNSFDDFICDAAEKIASERTHKATVERERELRSLLIESIKSGECSLRVNIERLIRLEAVSQAIELN